MATRNDMELLAGKAMIENSFRHALQLDPKAAAKSVGVTLTDNDVTALKNVNWAALDELSAKVQAAVSVPKMEWGG